MSPPFLTMESAMDELQYYVDQIQHVYKITKSETFKTKGQDAFQLHLENLETKWQQFEKHYLYIVKKYRQKERDDHPFFKNKSLETTRGMYDESKLALKRQLLKPMGSVNPENNSENKQSVQTPVAHSTQADEPKFDGSLAQWVNFKKSFESSLSSKSALSNREKLNFLKNSLIENGVELVSEGEDDFDRAWKQIVWQYDNPYFSKRHIAFNLLRRQAEDFEFFLRQVRFLKNLDVTMEDLLLYIIMIKFHVLPMRSDLLKKWDNYVLQDESKEVSEFTCADFVSFVSKYINYCCKCKEHHHLSRCPAFSRLPVDERKLILRNHNICFRCLEFGHSLRMCRTNLKCEKCGQTAHHTLLHFEHTYRHSADSNNKRSAPDSGAGSYADKLIRLTANNPY